MQSRVLSTYVPSISNQPFIFRVSIRPHIHMGSGILPERSPRVKLPSCK